MSHTGTPFSSPRTAAREPQRLGLWLLLVLSVFALAPGVHPGLVQTRAGFVAAWNTTAPAALANVATEPDLWRGLGGGALLPVQPLLLFGVPPARAVQWVMLSCLLLGALGIYIWLQQRLGDRAAGLAALLYLFLPAVLAIPYFQGSLSGALLLALLPLTLAGLSVYGAQRSLLAASVAVICILWMVRVQAGAALIALLVAALYALTVERSRTALLIVLASGAAGFVSTIPLWGTVAPLEMPALLTLSGLLRSSGSGSAPFQIGIGAFVLTAVTVWGLATQRVAEAERRLLWFAVGASAVLCALALPWSVWLWQVGGARLLNSPWELGLVAAPFLAAAGGGAAALLPELQRPAYLGTIAAVIVLASAPYRVPTYTMMTPPPRPVAMLGQNQIALLAAHVQEFAAPARAELTLTWQVLRPLDLDLHLFFQALTADTPSAIVAQLDAPPLADTPATRWQPGDLYTATYILERDADVGSPLVYYVGLYDWRDGSRLAVNAGLDDKLILYGAP